MKSTITMSVIALAAVVVLTGCGPSSDSSSVATNPPSGVLTNQPVLTNTPAITNMPGNTNMPATNN